VNTACRIGKWRHEDRQAKITSKLGGGRRGLSPGPLSSTHRGGKEKIMVLNDEEKKKRVGERGPSRQALFNYRKNA